MATSCRRQGTSCSASHWVCAMAVSRALAARWTSDGSLSSARSRGRVKRGPPTKHQLALMIWLAVFPALTVLNLVLGDWLDTLNAVTRTFVPATIAVPIVIYGLMPQLHHLRGQRLTASPARHEGTGQTMTPTSSRDGLTGKGRAQCRWRAGAWLEALLAYGHDVHATTAVLGGGASTAFGWVAASLRATCHSEYPSAGPCPGDRWPRAACQ